MYTPGVQDPAAGVGTSPQSKATQHTQDPTPVEPSFKWDFHMGVQLRNTMAFSSDEKWAFSLTPKRPHTRMTPMGDQDHGPKPSTSAASQDRAYGDPIAVWYFEILVNTSTYNEMGFKL